MAKLTKKARTAYFSGILHGAQIGETINGHFEELLELLREHPDAENKIGCGVAAFKVDLVPPYLKRGFHVIRTDGSVEDFSYRICLNGYQSKKQEATRALRNEVFEQIDAVRRRVLAGEISVCAETGAPIGAGGFEIHHAPPNTFARIVSLFVSAEKIEIEKIKTKEGNDGVTFALADRKLAQRWRAHPQSLADLCAVSVHGHKMAHAANDNTPKDARKEAA